MKPLHDLKIKKTGSCTEIELDGFKIQGVTEYEVKSSAKTTAELTLKMIVGNLNVSTVSAD